MPGDEICLAFLFSGDAPRIRKRTRNAEANTRKPCGVLRRSEDSECLWKRMRLVGPASGLRLLRNLLSIFFRVMDDVRVSKKARITDGTAYSLYTATPLPFVYLHFADIVDVALLTTLSLYLCTNRCHSLLPLWSAHASCCLVLRLPTSVWGAMVDDHHACSPAHWLNPSGSFSCISYWHYAVSACELLLFHSYFNLGVILIYSPRSYEAGAFLSFGPAWTAYGLGQ